MFQIKKTYVKSAREEEMNDDVFDAKYCKIYNYKCAFMDGNICRFLMRSIFFSDGVCPLPKLYAIRPGECFPTAVGIDVRKMEVEVIG